MRLQIRFTGVAVITLFLLLDRTGLGSLGLAVCAIHELGHLLAFLLLRRIPACLSLEWNGIRLEEPREGLTSREWLFVLLAGSLLNLLFFLLLLPLLTAPSRAGVFAAMHLVVGLYNLLPLPGLDGGRLLSHFLYRHCTPSRAAGWCRCFTLVTLAAVGTGCLFLLGGGVGGVSATVLFCSLVYAASRRTASAE